MRCTEVAGRPFRDGSPHRAGTVPDFLPICHPTTNCRSRCLPLLSSRNLHPRCRLEYRWGLARAIISSRGDCPWFLVFCPKGAQGDSPGQRPVGWNVAIESRPEGAEPNGAEINGSSYPGRRFALPWAISFCPFGAEK
jgi:hypothetical protein